LKKAIIEKDTVIKLLKVEISKISQKDFIPKKVQKRLNELIGIKNIILDKPEKPKQS
jgi:hypothetical protein